MPLKNKTNQFLEQLLKSLLTPIDKIKTDISAEHLNIDASFHYDANETERKITLAASVSVQKLTIFVMGVAILAVFVAFISV